MTHPTNAASSKTNDELAERQAEQPDHVPRPLSGLRVPAPAPISPTRPHSAPPSHQRSSSKDLSPSYPTSAIILPALITKSTKKAVRNDAYTPASLTAPTSFASSNVPRYHMTQSNPNPDLSSLRTSKLVRKAPSAQRPTVFISTVAILPIALQDVSSSPAEEAFLLPDTSETIRKVGTTAARTNQDHAKEYMQALSKESTPSLSTSASASPISPHTLLTPSVSSILLPDDPDSKISAYNLLAGNTSQADSKGKDTPDAQTRTPTLSPSTSTNPPSPYTPLMSSILALSSELVDNPSMGDTYDDYHPVSPDLENPHKMPRVGPTPGYPDRYPIGLTPFNGPSLPGTPEELTPDETWDGVYHPLSPKLPLENEESEIRKAPTVGWPPASSRTPNPYLAAGDDPSARHYVPASSETSTKWNEDESAREAQLAKILQGGWKLY